MSGLIHFAGTSNTAPYALHGACPFFRKERTMAIILRQLAVFACGLALLLIPTIRPAAAQNSLYLSPGDEVTVSSTGTNGIYFGQPINNSVSTYTANTGVAVSVLDDGTFTLKDGGSLIGTVSSVLQFAGGDGLFNGSTSTTTVTGGTISGDAAGIINQGTLTISGGMIMGNGWGLSAESGSVTVSGGTIIGNTLWSIYSTSSSITVTGGSMPNGIDLLDSQAVITGGAVSGSIGALGITNPSAVSITGGSISAELYADAGSTIDLFGNFTATDYNGNPVSSPISGTFGKITGNLLDGEVIQVPFTAINGTIEFNVGTPPLTVTGVRLGLPALVTNGSSRTLKQSVYVKGVGVGAVSGYWLEDNNKKQPISINSVDLTSGIWIKLNDFQDTLLGPHTLQFVANSQASSVEDVAITGFIPSQDGWNFPNDVNKYTTPPNYNFIDRLFYKFDGFCEGFAQSARDYYIKYPTVPQPRYGSTRVIYSLLRTDQLNGNAWWQQYDDSPGFENCLSIFRNTSTYDDILDEEASKLQMRIQSGDPCVIDIFTLQTLQQFNNNQGEQGHAVVGTAAFFSDNIYKADTQREINTMHLFSIYDPNNPGADSEYVGSFDTGNPTPYFVFLGYDYSAYNFGLWLENTYHYTKTNF